MSLSRQDKAKLSRRSVAALGLACAVVLCSCAPTLEEETAALFDTDVRFAATSREAGMAEAFYRFMAPDGFLLRPGDGPIRGPQAARDRMSGRTDVILTWSPQGAEVSSSRDLGYTWGIYAVETVAPEGPVRLGTGKYLNVWRRQPDGTWKVLVDIGNEDPAANGRSSDD